VVIGGAHEYGTAHAWHGCVQRCMHIVQTWNINMRRTGRVLVYGGMDMIGGVMASVEMLSLDGHSWQTLPTPMFKADYSFASVPLPETTSHNTAASCIYDRMIFIMFLIALFVFYCVY
jgi:hypothetical protein